MNNILLNRRNCLTKLSVASQLIVSSLFLGLAGNLGMSVSAQPSIAPVVAQSQPAPATNPVAQKILGQWQAKDPSGQDLLMFVFAPENKLYIVLPSPEKPAPAVEMRYRIDAAQNPMHLDVQINSDDTVMTVFEVSPDGKMRLQLDGTNPGVPRPTALTDAATVFEKVSDATTVPADSEVVGFEEQKGMAQQSEARLFMSALNRAQQAYFLENNKFAAAIEELGLGIKPETEFYRYQIVPQGDATKSVLMTAQAKSEELKSYSGAVFMMTVNPGEAVAEDLTIPVLCETEQPSTSPPPMPTAPSTATGQGQCPAGSVAVTLR
ncbi:type IV pilin-like G/H family protein [Microcoleus sp. FACHB-672]|uniref:type IV pilin-like G/H family protein n=1 Tax=Microcoleus sp. FACHB-672 TaxID=2692825 RepID=UPI0016878DBE|nr:type IV pilin-like G/H family protein [Microcoleus sp. FACHB-672]MBD2043384.1 type IV pilin-like G/H family protein [Microcoleus sp. FACHB-672]